MENNKKQKIIKIAGVFFAFLLIASASPVNASEITAQKMVDLMNESRVEAGLEPLAVNEKLEQSAKAKADDMFAKQYFDHISPEGLTPWYWFGLSNYEYAFAAENLAIDFVTAEGAHNAFMKSTGHRENILGVDYKEIGIAVASGEFENKESIIIVEEFGSQREQKIMIVDNALFSETVEETETKTEIETEVRADAVQTEEKAQVVEESKKEDSDIDSIEEETRSEMESVPVPAEMPVQKIETLVEVESAFIPEETDEADTENKTFEQAVEMNCADTSKAVAKIYDIKSVQELKKVYTENIYWKGATGQELEESPNGNAARMKILIKSLTGSILYALFED